ncbi:MAG: PAS domain-containing protein [Anditalea sp.]
MAGRKRTTISWLDKTIGYINNPSIKFNMPQSEKQNKQQIKELIELNDELENYFRNTIIPQLFVDANLILRKFTPLAMKQFSISPDDIGRSMEELLENIRYSTIIENINEVIDTEEAFEKEIQTSDFRWFQMNIIPYLVQKKNKTNGVIITFIDITDRMKSLKELEKLNASHETFIYSVSHDLKAPLANIEELVKYLVQSFADLMEKFDTDNEEHKSIETMLNKSVNSMKDIINELSEITRIESNYKEEVETVRFENIINEVKITLNDRIVDNKALIYVDIKEPEIEFPRKNLRSIIYNLLSNAIKCQSPNRTPEIHIKTEKVDGSIQISVKDNGLGIADDKKDLLFTAYFRLEKKVEGTGIGLYLVKKSLRMKAGRSWSTVKLVRARNLLYL